MEDNLIEVKSLDELNCYFEIQESFLSFYGLNGVNEHSLLLKLPYEHVNDIGDNIKPLIKYFYRSRELGYSVKVEQIGEAIGDPFIITHVTFSHPGIAGLLEKDMEAA